MLIKTVADIPSSDITDKRLYMNRRAFIQSATGAALSTDQVAGNAGMDLRKNF
jgi:hypothetical protein